MILSFLKTGKTIFMKRVKLGGDNFAKPSYKLIYIFRADYKYP